MLPGDFIKLIYWDCKLKIVGNSLFRMDFLYSMLTSFIFSCGIPLFQFFIYSKTNGYNGWSFHEILLFQAVLLLCLGINETLFGDIRPLVERTVQFGLFDRLLLFPYQPLVVILSRGFSQKSAGTMLAGAAALMYVILKYKLAITILQFVCFLGFLVTGMLFRLTFIIVYCALTLRFIYLDRAKEIMDRFLSFGNFPAEIFTGAFHFVYLTLVPIGVCVYFPVQSLLGRLDVYAVSGVLVAIGLFVVSVVFWNRQLGKYSSSGG